MPTITQIRLDNITTCLTAAVSTLELVSNNLSTPYLKPISNTARSLVTSAQTIRQNKNDCAQLMERLHELLYAIIGLHINSDTAGELSPSMLNHVAKFIETLNKIHTFVEAQQDKNRIKQFFRQVELTALLKDCNAELQEAIDTFKLPAVSLATYGENMERYIQERHQEVVQLIESLSDGTGSDNASSISRVFSGSHNSSTSFSMLPAEPKIFHGRESELADIIKLFEGTPRVAILGPGGMGKTSLARAILHHSEITSRYQQLRFFVACDTVSTSTELAALIGSQLGLKPGKDMMRAVIHHFSNNPACILILDNMETIWEPQESRGAVEEFLSLLTGVDHLALIITMRGAERPAKVRWTRPFLPPLKPLSQDAARQTFIEIVDDGYDKEDMDKILQLTDNMPLAIDLIAHLVDSEGCPNVLSRWEKEKTSLLSEGYDRRSNLDLSISLSLASSRITSMPHSVDLLSLLSMQPDGLSDTELLQSKLPIDNILGCKAALLSTSLVYIDGHKRVKLLVPIREYIQKFHPPGDHLVKPLCKHFYDLLELYRVYSAPASTSGPLARIASNFANIQSLLLNGLHKDNPDLVQTIYCAISLHQFSRLTGRVQIPSIDQISHVLPRPIDHRLEVCVIAEVFTSWMYCPIPNPQALVVQALDHFNHFNDPDLKCRFYLAMGYYYLGQRDFTTAMPFIQTAHILASSTGSIERQATSLGQLGAVKSSMGDFLGAKNDACEMQKLAKICGNRFIEAQAILDEAMCWSKLGNYNHAISLFNFGMDLVGLCGLSRFSDDHLSIMHHAEAFKFKSEYLESRAMQKQILDGTWVNLNPGPLIRAGAFLNIAEIDVTIGAPTDVVQRNINAAKSIFDHVHIPWGLAWCDRILGNLHLREGNMGVAKALFEKCVKSTSATVQAVTSSLEKLADGSNWSATNWTFTWTIVLLVYSLKSKRKPEIYKALLFQGDVFLADDDEDTAISLFTLALEAFTHMDIHQSRAECMLRLGDILNHGGDLIKAAEHWRTARALFDRSSQAKRVADIDERLGSLAEQVVKAHTESLPVLSGIRAPATRPELPGIRHQGRSEVQKMADVALDAGGKELVPAAV